MTTKEQALEALEAWGNPKIGYETFNGKRKAALALPYDDTALRELIAEHAGAEYLRGLNDALQLCRRREVEYDKRGMKGYWSVCAALIAAGISDLVATTKPAAGK